MGIKLEEYRRKSNKLIGTIVLIGIAIIVLAILISIINYTVNKNKASQDNLNLEETIEEADNDDTLDNETDETKVTIEKSEEVLLNPGKGLVLTDFSSDDYDDIVSTGYYNFEWSSIETSEGEYNWDVIDTKLEEYANKGKTFAFGVVCADSDSSKEYVTPKWVFDAGAVYYTYSASSGIEQKIPVWTDEIFLEKLNNFITALAERYDGNENIAYIDIRSYGNSGEQNLETIGGTDITATQLKELYIEPYINAFKETLLVNPWGKSTYDDVYTWAIKKGVTIKREGILGYIDGLECFDKAYGSLPTIFGFGESYSTLKEQGIWSEKSLLEYINECKPSYIEIDPEMYAYDEEFCKYIANHIGYYFTFNDAKYEAKVKTDEETEITLVFENEGVAPLYEDCIAYIALLDEEYNVVKKYKTDIDAKSWQPGEETEENVSITFEDAEEGEYTLAVGLFLNEEDESPTYLLANENKTEDKWYYFGNIEITKSSNDEIKEYSSSAISVYTSFVNKYSDEFDSENLSSTKSKINKIKQSINDYSEDIENISEEDVEELIEDHYEIGTEIVNAYLDEEISEESLENMINDLEGITNLFEKIAILKIENTDNLNLATAYEELTSYRGEYYTDLGLSYIENLFEKAKSYYNDISQSDESAGKIITESYRSYYLAKWANDLLEESIDNYFSQNPVTVEYSNKDVTSGDVIATVKAGEDTSIKINSLEENTYTFTENGSLELEYTRRDTTGKVKISVDWIDKTTPTFSGVIPSKVYNEEVNITVKDNTEIDSIEVYRNSEQLSSYNINQESQKISISSVGEYKIVAKDTAGNSNEVVFYIYNDPAEITYSIADEWTNQDVTATISSDFEFEVTNNNGSNSRTFSGNGEFVFEYTITGTTYTKTAIVSNIDKTNPIISGVEDKCSYEDAVQPTISDENLKDVKLYKNSAIDSSYEAGSIISGAGLYELIATDLAGNETSVVFIIVNSRKSEYLLNDSYIMNIKENTKKSEFDENLKNSSENFEGIDLSADTYKITRNGKTITDKVTIVTGDILQTDDGNSYTLIVVGDINKDGENTIYDLVQLQLYLLQEGELNEEEMLAADCNLDGEITLKDWVKLRIMILTS